MKATAILLVVVALWAGVAATDVTVNDAAFTGASSEEVAVAGADAVAGAEAAGESDAEMKADSEAALALEAESEAEGEVSADAAAEVEAAADAEAEAEAETETETETESEAGAVTQAQLDAAHENLVATLESYAQKAHELKDEIISSEHVLMEEMASIDTCPPSQLSALMAKAKAQIHHLFQIKTLYLAIKQQSAQLQALLDAGTGKRAPNLAPAKKPAAAKPKPAAKKPAAAVAKPSGAVSSSMTPSQVAALTAMNKKLHNALARLTSVTARLARVEGGVARSKKAAMALATQMETDEKRMNKHARILKKLRRKQKDLKAVVAGLERSCKRASAAEKKIGGGKKGKVARKRPARRFGRRSVRRPARPSAKRTRPSANVLRRLRAKKAAALRRRRAGAQRRRRPRRALLGRKGRGRRQRRRPSQLNWRRFNVPNCYRRCRAMRNPTQRARCSRRCGRYAAAVRARQRGAKKQAKGRRLNGRYNTRALRKCLRSCKKSNGRACAKSCLRRHRLPGGRRPRRSVPQTAAARKAARRAKWVQCLRKCRRSDRRCRMGCRKRFGPRRAKALRVRRFQACVKRCRRNRKCIAQCRAALRRGARVPRRIRALRKCFAKCKGQKKCLKRCQSAFARMRRRRVNVQALRACYKRCRGAKKCRAACRARHIPRRRTVRVNRALRRCVRSCRRGKGFRKCVAVCRSKHGRRAAGKAKAKGKGLRKGKGKGKGKGRRIGRGSSPVRKLLQSCLRGCRKGRKGYRACVRACNKKFGAVRIPKIRSPSNKAVGAALRALRKAESARRKAKRSKRRYEKWSDVVKDSRKLLRKSVRLRDLVHRQVARYQDTKDVEGRKYNGWWSIWDVLRGIKPAKHFTGRAKQIARDVQSITSPALEDAERGPYGPVVSILKGADEAFSTKYTKELGNPALDLATNPKFDDYQEQPLPGARVKMLPYNPKRPYERPHQWKKTPPLARLPSMEDEPYSSNLTPIYAPDFKVRPKRRAPVRAPFKLRTRKWDSPQIPYTFPVHTVKHDPTQKNPHVRKPTPGWHADWPEYRFRQQMDASAAAGSAAPSSPAAAAPTPAAAPAGPMVEGTDA